MKFKIKKNKHRAWPLQLGLWYNKYALIRRITFGYGCNYYLSGEDAEDTNKLFGMSYTLSPHKESVRFGWLYKDGRIQINAYLYRIGFRTIEKLCDVPLGLMYEYSIIVNSGFYSFKVKNPANGMVLSQQDFNFTHTKKWSYPLNFFFGGNKSAPNTMEIEMTNP